MKKVLSFILVLSMVLGSMGMAFAAPTEAAQDSIDAMVDLGFVEGDEGGLRLDDPIRRSEVAVIAVRMAGLEDVALKSNYPGGFSDVTPDMWDNPIMNGAINVAAGQGYVRGYPEGTFEPNENVTNAEIITLMVRLAVSEEEVVELDKGAWPAAYITKAVDLGILENTDIDNYQDDATRETVFVLGHNAHALRVEQDLNLVNAIVLENYRTETLNEDEIVVQVLKDNVQRAGKPYEMGDTFNVKVTKELGDVEQLLGKVVNLAFNENEDVVRITVDESYDYLVGEVQEATDRRLRLDGRNYTVSKDAKYDDVDERLFQAYYNNEDVAYYETSRRGNELLPGTFVAKVNANGGEYAKITVKNGKVLFIDAFQFEDIAPVQEVKKGGDDVYFYDDAKNGDVTKLDLAEKNVDVNVVLVEGKEIAKATKADIKENDVIHFFATRNSRNDVVERTVFVRKAEDAKVVGEYDNAKARAAKDDNKITITVGKETYDVYADADNSRNAVYTYDEETFYTLSKDYDEDLAAFDEEDVTILLDMAGMVQYISAKVEDPNFYALVKEVHGTEIELIKADDSRDVYRTTIRTDYKEVGITGSIKEMKKDNLGIGDLVEVEAKDAVITKITKLADFMDTKAKKVVDGSKNEGLTKDYIEFEDDDYNYLRNSTVYFVSGINKLNDKDVLKGVSLADLRDSKKYGTDNRKAFVETTDSEGKLANVVVFTEVEVKVQDETETVKVDRVTMRGNAYSLTVIDTDGEKTTHKVTGDNAKQKLKDKKVVEGVIIEMTVTKNDAKDIREIDVVELREAKNGLFRVTKVGKDTGRNDDQYVVLRDSKGDTETVWLSRDAKTFGDYREGSLVAIRFAPKGKDVVNVIASRPNSKNIVESKDWDGSGKDDDVEIDGVVTYIDGNGTLTSAERMVSIGTKEYKVALAAIDFFNDYVEKDDEIAFELNAAGDIAKVTVLDKDVTVDNTKTVRSFTDLVITGDLTVDGVKLTTKGITVKGDTDVINGGEIESNTTFEGNVKIDATSKGTFTNVTFKKALAVADGANVTFNKGVTVSGEITGAKNIDVTNADASIKEKVEDAKEADEEEAAQEALENVLTDAANVSQNNGEPNDFMTLGNLTVSGKKVTARFFNAEKDKIKNIYNSLTPDENEMVEGTGGLKDAKEYAIDSYVMNTLARYLGALERVNGSPVKKIEFDGVVYTAEGSRKGSNWMADGKSLVSAIVDEQNTVVRNVTFTIVDEDGYSIDVNFVADSVPTVQDISWE